MPRHGILPRRYRQLQTRITSQTYLEVNYGPKYLRDIPYPCVLMLFFLGIIVVIQLLAPYPLRISDQQVRYNDQMGYNREIVRNSTGTGNFSNILSRFRNNQNPATIWNTPVQLDWQNVSEAQFELVVYSAYYVQKLNEIRIIGAARFRAKMQVKCLLCDQNLQRCITVYARIQMIREHWQLKYSACFVLCALPLRTNVSILRFVSVIPQIRNLTNAVQGPQSNILPIHFPGHKMKSKIEFSVCVKPIHYNYDNVLKFMEWMEFHRIMGVGHFTFFNKSIGPGVSCLLKQVYGNIVTVLPWNLPFVSQKEIRTEGIFAALNDCLYRHRGASQHLILLDLDEMIVPQRAQNYAELMTQLNQLKDFLIPMPVGAYVARNVFFYLEWPNREINMNFTEDPLVRSVAKQLVMVTKTRRLNRINLPAARSKYICIPDRVMEVGNHFIWQFVTGFGSQYSPPQLMLLHHYRNCEIRGHDCIKNSSSVVDRSTHPFEGGLILNVATKLREFEEKCEEDISQWLSPT